jgi:hypothetical protein
MIKAKYKLSSILAHSFLGIFSLFTIFALSTSITSAVTTTTTTTVLTANLSPVLFLSSSNCGSACNLNFTPTGAGTYCSTFDTVTYYTNSSGGYSLYISDNSSSTSALTGAGTIPSAATVSAGGSASALSINTWGYSAYPDPKSLSSANGVSFGGTANASTNYPSGVSLGSLSSGLQTALTTGTAQCGVSSFTGSPTFAGMPTSSNIQLISYSNAPVATTYSTVFYGIYANTAKPSGAYQTTVLYTLSTSP